MPISTNSEMVSCANQNGQKIKLHQLASSNILIQKKRKISLHILQFELQNIYNILMRG